MFQTLRKQITNTSVSKYYFSGKWLATVHYLSQESIYTIQTYDCCLGELIEEIKTLLDFFPALSHSICVEHAQGQICFMGCRKGVSLWLTVLFYYTQKEPSSQGTTTTTLFSTKAEPRVELVWELDKERLSICILCRLYNLIDSAEA